MGDLRILVSGGGRAGNVTVLIEAAVAHGWSVDVTATQSALDFLDVAAVARASGHPVRTRYRFGPDGALVSPSADAMIIAPATYNTINKLALGIADTYATSSAAEVIGRGVPTVIVPSVNAALAARLPFQASLRTLRSEGVRVLYGPQYADLPWLEALELVEGMAGRPATRLPDHRAATRTSSPSGSLAELLAENASETPAGDMA